MTPVDEFLHLSQAERQALTASLTTKDSADKMTQHTALPWSAINAAVYGPDGFQVASMEGADILRAKDTRRVNAEFIALACNSFNDLRTACKRAHHELMNPTTTTTGHATVLRFIESVLARTP